MSMAQVKEWLAQQGTYVRFQQPQKNFKLAQTYVPFLGDQLQIDLVDMSKYEVENKSYRWILTANDVFSRYFFAVPLRRMHKELRLMPSNFYLINLRHVLVNYQRSFKWMRVVSLRTLKFYHS